MKYSKTKQKVHKLQQNIGKTKLEKQPHKAAAPVEERWLEEIESRVGSRSGEG
jgi:hypothetical protein